MTHQRLQLTASHLTRIHKRARGGFILREGASMLFHSAMRNDHAGDAGG